MDYKAELIQRNNELMAELAKEVIRWQALARDPVILKLIKEKKEKK